MCNSHPLGANSGTTCVLVGPHPAHGPVFHATSVMDGHHDDTATQEDQ